MELHVDDDGFVRAAAPLVYTQLTDIGSWDTWWPGLAASAVPADAETWRLELRAGRTRLRVTAVPHAWRLDTGFAMHLSGDLDGRSEFWLERGWDGTVVHHLLQATTSRRAGRRVLRTYRRVLRQGLWACKDRLQAEARRDEGLPA